MNVNIPLISQSAISNPDSAFVSYPLCQPDPSKSCGACCGLYNWEDHSRMTLEFLLQKRTSLFFSWGKDPERYQKSYSAEPAIPNPKLLETIYNCEFLGFLDSNRKRVGCLLHPSANRGVDLRDFCFYGAELCTAHFCPSFTHLTRVEQKAVIAALDDWYLYGLVITDIDLIKDFCNRVQDRLGDSLREERLEDFEVRRALQDLFGFKESWKFASSRARLGKYYFSQSEYQIARIEYEKNWKIKPSRFDKILVSLSSDFKTEDEVFEAESLIEEKINNFLRVYERINR
jgi:hypothetical protein